MFVTQFFAELVPAGPGETFDDGKQIELEANWARARRQAKLRRIAPLE